MNYFRRTFLLPVLALPAILASCSSDPSPSINASPFIKNLGASGVDRGVDIGVDAHGNSYVVGTFGGSTKIGSETITSESSYDNSFITKINSKGEVVWAKGMIGTQEVSVTGISVDGAGNSYICGYMLATATFGDKEITTAGNYDIFIAKYNTSGDVEWVKNTGGPNNDQPNDIVVDGKSNVYITGTFYASTTIGSTSMDGKSYDIFAAKFDSKGDNVWAQKVGGCTAVEEDSGNGITLDAAGNVFVTGFVNDNAVIGTDSFDGTGKRFFFAKYNAAGDYQWARAGYDEFSEAFDVAVDPTGNIYITGGMGVTFYPVQGSFLYNSASNYGFLLKYDASGNYKWGRNIPGQNSISNVATDAKGGVYVAAQFDGSSGTVYFNGKSGAVAQFNTLGQTDAYVAKFDDTGFAVWAKRGGSADFDVTNAIALDRDGNVYSTGYFWGNDFSTDIGDVTKTTSSSDAQVWKIKQL